MITHDDAQSVGLLWTSDQQVIETSNWQHTKLTIDRHPCPRWGSNPRSQQTNLFVFGASPQWARASSFARFLDHTQWRTIVGRPPLDEWSASNRDLYLTTHNTHNRQTSMPPTGFESEIPASERPQTHALDLATTGTGRNEIQVLCTDNNNDVIFRSKIFIIEKAKQLFDIQSLRSHNGSRVDSASNINEYQEYFLGVKATGHL